MRNLKWTPGPWFALDDHPDHACYHIGPEGSTPLEVASVYSPGDEKADADAHLIAASPDLYEALNRLWDLANHFNVSGVYFSEVSENYEALVAAENALARARGEQP